MKICANIAALCIIFLTGVFQSASAQVKLSNNIEVDKTVHNFGDIMLDSGPVSCTFTFKNIGSQPVVIYSAVTTCGCTKAEWTKEPIMPGKTGTVSATYSNDEGAYPFDKNMTVYLSDPKKPVILKMKGVSVAKKVPLDQTYTVRYGPLGLRESYIQCGNMEQGGMKSGSVTIANISGSPANIKFENISDFLDIRVTPNPIPAGKTAEMAFTVTADSSLWGKNDYKVTPVINGKKYRNAEGSQEITIWANTKENFDNLTEDQKSSGARPDFKASTYTFGKMKAGGTVNAEFSFKNVGKTDFKVYKADADAKNWSHSEIPVVKPGENSTFKVTLDTTGMPLGETLVIVTLTTNSPLRPIVNLFITGWLE